MPCPICNSDNIERSRISSEISLPPNPNVGLWTNKPGPLVAIRFSCKRCGEFVVTNWDIWTFLETDAMRSEARAPHISALLREQSTHRLPPFWVQFVKGSYGPLKAGGVVPIHVDELLAGWPQSVPERIDRALRNLGYKSGKGGIPTPVEPGDFALVFAEDDAEARYHVRCLRDLQYLNPKSTHVIDMNDVVLTAQGWQKFEELTRGLSKPENDAFVAMWFGVEKKKRKGDWTEAEMKAVYDEGIERGVLGAGYRCSRVNLKPFNDFIMDKVLGDTRMAPFVVADFTGNRNGVYFEAGFARGFGIPVIHTCHTDHFEKAHFDIKQLNCIQWKNAAELREKVTARILGTLDRGPHALETGN
ncbi:MAG: hypothetical protein HOP29_06300 [Phycisphaerales bacterium]|nr:hypothetical protein [Phycisphaerales bacterium]